MLGRVDRGIRELKEALQVASKEGFRRCSTFALLYLGQIHLLKQETIRARDYFEEAELMAHGGEERFVDILFQTAYHLWDMARTSRNQVQEKVYFGRLKFLRSQIDRQFQEVEHFDQFIEQGKGRRVDDPAAHAPALSCDRGSRDSAVDRPCRGQRPGGRARPL